MCTLCLCLCAFLCIFSYSLGFVYWFNDVFVFFCFCICLFVFGALICIPPSWVLTERDCTSPHLSSPPGTSSFTRICAARLGEFTLHKLNYQMLFFLKASNWLFHPKTVKKPMGSREINQNYACRAQWCSSSTATRWTEECSSTTTSASTLATSPAVPHLLTRWGKHLYLVATQLHMFHAMSSWCPCCRIKSQHHNANSGALPWRWLYQRHLRGRHGQDREDVDTISQEKNDLDFSSP